MKFKSPIPSFVSPTIIEASSLLKDIADNLIEIERLKRRISKYKKDDEDRRQGRKD